MKQEQKEIIAGVVLSVLLLLLLGFVHSRSAVHKESGPFTLYAYFSKADGLMPGADVRIAGIPVGTVTNQTLKDNYTVQVAMSFDKPVELSEDSSVRIETDGLLGTKHIEIVPGGDDEILESGDDISYHQDALILGELIEKVNDMMRQKKIAEGKITDETDTKKE